MSNPIQITITISITIKVSVSMPIHLCAVLFIQITLSAEGQPIIDYSLTKADELMVMAGLVRTRISHAQYLTNIIVTCCVCSTVCNCMKHYNIEE